MTIYNEYDYIKTNIALEIITFLLLSPFISNIIFASICHFEVDPIVIPFFAATSVMTPLFALLLLTVISDGPDRLKLKCLILPLLIILCSQTMMFKITVWDYLQKTKIDKETEFQKALEYNEKEIESNVDK